MALKLLQITAPIAAEAKLKKLAGEYEAVSFHKGVLLDDDHALFFLLTRPTRRQRLIDELQEVLLISNKARVNILSVDATLPAVELDNAVDTREELYQKMDRGAKLDGTYITLVTLSTIVALIGLLQDNVAVVVGAMVIAPLLGPNLALALGTSLGDKELMKKSLVTAFAGVSVALVLSALTGYIWGEVPASHELMSRTSVGYDGVALAIASGVAGVLSLTSGLSMTLVGVMVAVALLPPTATFGFMLGVGQVKPALGALMLLSVNIVCVNLSGLLVLMTKGFRPRLWFERKMAKPYILSGIIIWTIFLFALMAVIF